MASHGVTAPMVGPAMMATQAATAAPANSCPSAPMLNTPALNAMAVASPVSINGVARTSVPDVSAYHDPNEPFQSARSTAPAFPCDAATMTDTAPIATTQTMSLSAERPRRDDGGPPRVSPSPTEITSDRVHRGAPPGAESTRCRTAGLTPGRGTPSASQP